MESNKDLIQQLSKLKKSIKKIKDKIVKEFIDISKKYGLKQKFSICSILEYSCVSNNYVAVLNSNLDTITLYIRDGKIPSKNNVFTFKNLIKYEDKLKSLGK